MRGRLWKPFKRVWIPSHFLNQAKAGLDWAGRAIAAEDRKKALETVGSMDDVLALFPESGPEIFWASFF